MTQQEALHIHCDDLFKIYKASDLEVVALRGLDFSVKYGEVVGIVGASGSGKSTLLNILAGYDNPSAGRISVGGRDLLRMGSKEIEDYRREEIGFLWQQTSRNLFTYLSAVENVGLPMMLTDLSASEREKRAVSLLEMVGLGHRAEHTPDRLSGGEQQRVAIAVALANHPALLLADEPTGELDSATAGEILDLFGEVNTEFGTTILIVTHDPEISRKVGRVVTIKDGKMSTEVRRKITFRRVSGTSETAHELEEFALIDSSGRVQIPRELLERLNIRDKARLSAEDGRVTLQAEDEASD